MALQKRADISDEDEHSCLHKLDSSNDVLARAHDKSIAKGIETGIKSSSGAQTIRS
jgi:hypothetical protein